MLKATMGLKPSMLYLKLCMKSDIRLIDHSFYFQMIYFFDAKIIFI